MNSPKSSLSLSQTSVSAEDNNVYLIASEAEGLLIDAADNPVAIEALAKDAGVRITAILTTHRHWDHVRALPSIIDTTGATHYASFLDAPALPAPVDVELHHGDILPFAGEKFEVSILRGHTPGGVCLAVPLDGVIHLFLGDSLFPGGVGHTVNESDFSRLFNDVKTRVFDVYPDDTVVHPGHGLPTTLGAERPHLEEWRQRGW